jgi:hypothetical protein
MSEDMDPSGRRDSSDSVGERHRGQIDQIGALAKTNGPPRSPMHGDSVGGLSAADDLGRLPGVEMAPAKGGSPASDWNKGKVDLSHFAQREVRAGVPGIPAPMVSDNQVAERRSAMRASRESPAVMVGSQDAYP